LAVNDFRLLEKSFEKGCEKGFESASGVLPERWMNFHWKRRAPDIKCLVIRWFVRVVYLVQKLQF
jgi:hypothetical protein